MLRPYTHYMKLLLSLPIALLYYWVLLLKNTLVHRQWALYRTNYDIYLLAQWGGGSQRAKLAELLLDMGERLGSKALDWNYAFKAASRSSLSADEIQKFASDDSVYGYADLDETAIERQQRGLILPMIRSAIDKAVNKRVARPCVVEIGTANGDVLVKLAREYPQCDFVGVDFSIKKAVERHRGVTNARFLKGYALDLLQNNHLHGDVLFASSTFVLFAPLELARYLDEIKKAGFTDVVLNEPSWGGVVQTNDARAYSLHLEQGVWFHNWCGYLRRAGYQIRDLKSFHYKHEVSVRPDIFVTLVWACI